MNKEQKKLLTSNLTFLKDRLRHLDPIIDYLVDKNIITEQQRDQINQVSPSTQHRRFNEFLSVFLSSDEDSAFAIFIEALVDSRYYNIVEKLQKDGSRFNVREASFIKATKPKAPVPLSLPIQPAQKSFTSIVHMMKDPDEIEQVPETRSFSEDIPPPVPAPQAQPKNIRPVLTSNSGTTKEVQNTSDIRRVTFSTSEYPMTYHHDSPIPICDSPSPMLADQMTSAFGQIFADFSSKLTNDLLDGFERRRHEDRLDMEMKMEGMIQKHVDDRIDDKLQIFRDEWEEEKKKILKRNEHSMAILQGIVDQLNCTNDAYTILKEKYDQIKQSHGMLREKENERWQKLVIANKERTQLKGDNEKLKSDTEGVKERMFEIKAENKELMDKERQNQHIANQLNIDKENILMELERSEREKRDLKRRIDSLGMEIDKLISDQQNNEANEDKLYLDTLRKQNERLEELQKVVQTLTERDKQAKNVLNSTNRQKTLPPPTRPPSYR